MTENRQIFLCHASEDKSRVLEVYERLRQHGLDPWLDKENLLPGQRWEDEIPRAIRESAVVLVFLSTVSVKKRGYVQKEFKLALETLDQIPSDQVFLIPVKLDTCDVPEVFRQFQWSALYDPGGLEKVLESICKQIGPTPSQDENVSQPDRSIANAVDRRRSGIDPSNSSHLEALKSQAMSGDTPKTRQNAIRSLARHLGARAGEWLAQLAWSSRFSAARCEAIDQVAHTKVRDCLEWLKEVAEQHPDKACRARAAEQVVNIDGLSSCVWIESLIHGERDYLVTYTIGHAFYRQARSAVSRAATGSREAGSVLQRILSRLIGEDLRVCLLASAILLTDRNDETREWAIRTAADAKTDYGRAKCLTVVLRCWPECEDAKQGLELIIQKSDGVAANHAAAYLKWINQGNWNTIDKHLGLGRL